MNTRDNFIKEGEREVQKRREWNIEEGDYLLMMRLDVVDPSSSSFRLSKA